MQKNDTSRNGHVKSEPAPEDWSWSSIPHRMGPYLRSKRLLPVDVVVTVFILKRLCNRSEGYATNKWLAFECGLTVRTIQRSLQRLEETGWFRFAPDETPAGRKITRLWPVWGDTKVTPPPDTDVIPPMTAMSSPPMTPVSPKEQRRENKQKEKKDVTGLPLATTNGETAKRSQLLGTWEEQIQKLEAVLVALWNAKQNPLAVARLVAEGQPVLQALLEDKAASERQHRAWLKEVARRELDPDVFWGAYFKARDQLSGRKDPLENFAAYFTSVLNTARGIPPKSER